MNTEPTTCTQPDDGVNRLPEIRRHTSDVRDRDPHHLGARLRDMEKLPQYAHRIVQVKNTLKQVKP